MAVVPGDRSHWRHRIGNAVYDARLTSCKRLAAEADSACIASPWRRIICRTSRCCSMRWVTGPTSVSPYASPPRLCSCSEHDTRAKASTPAAVLARRLAGVQGRNKPDEGLDAVATLIIARGSPSVRRGPVRETGTHFVAMLTLFLKTNPGGAQGI